MAAIQDVARQFFEACEAGKGWATCQAYCKPDASFSSQAEPLVDVKTLQGYADLAVRRRHVRFATNADLSPMPVKVAAFRAGQSSTGMEVIRSDQEGGG